MRGGWVYILASGCNGTLYIGVTSDLASRIWLHRTQPKGFVKRYGLRLLVHVEEYPTVDEGHRPGESHEKMESRLEAEDHRRSQSGLA